MLAPLPFAVLLACSLFPVANSTTASTRPTSVEALDDALIVAEGVDPHIAAAVSSFVAVAREREARGVRKSMDMDVFMDRVEDHLGESIGSLEGRVLGVNLVDPILESALLQYFDGVSDNEVEVRQQTKEAGRVRVVLRLRGAQGYGDTYVLLSLVDSEEGARVVDCFMEDAYLWCSEAVAFAKSLSDLSTAKQRRLLGYTDDLNTALAEAEVDPQGALSNLLGLERRAHSFPSPMGESHDLAVMTVALAAGEHQLAHSLSTAISSSKAELPWPWYVRGASALELGSPEEARTYLAEYQRIVGFDARSRELTGDAFEVEGDIDKALAEWRTALDDEPNSFDSLYSLGLYLSGDELEELVTRYRARTLETNLELLFDAWWNQGRCEAVSALSAYCRTEDDPDANAWYYEGKCAIDAGAFETAARLAREGYELAPDDELSAYEAIWIEASLELLPALEVYRGSQDPELAFDYACQSVFENLEQLEALIVARAEDEPTSRWLPYYRGELLRQRGDFAAAEEQFELGLQRAVKNGLDSCAGDYRHARTWNFFEAGTGNEAYVKMPVDEVWRWSRDWAIEAEDGPVLSSIVRTRREHAPKDPQLNYYVAKAFLLRGQLENGLAVLLEGHEAWRLDEELLPLVEYDLVMTLIALERYEEALAFAKRSTEGDGDPYYELVVHLAADEVAQVERVFALLVSQGYSPQVLYGGLEQREKLLSQDAYASLRERFPPAPDARGDARED